jgi:hypothetical protein
MLREPEILTALRTAITETLTGAGVVKVVETTLRNQSLFQGRTRPDLTVDVETQGGGRYLIVVEVKSYGQPRYASMGASQLRYMIEGREKTYGIFGAPFVSEESRAICRASGIGFIDLAGNCFIRFNGVYVSREGRPNPYPGTRPMRSIFAPRATRALRAMLLNPRRIWLVRDLATEAGISLGQASNLKKQLLNYSLIGESADSKTGFSLADPQSLLDAWASKYDYRSNGIRDYYSPENVRVFEKRVVDYLRANGMRYALTMTSGAARVAPFLRYSRAFSYVDGDQSAIAKDLGLKRVPSGANVTLLQPYDEGVYYGSREIDGAIVVSDIQLYLDLKGYKERGEEAAAFILENRLRKQW